MKTTEIKNVLKANLLIVELPIVCDYELTKEGLFVKEHGSHLSDYIEGSYTLLGKPDEISEDAAAEVVEPPIDKWGDDKFRFLDYRHDGYYDLFTAKESLMSALETQIYWENPVVFDDNETNSEVRGDARYKWELAESRTFDRNRTLIFKKN